MNHSLLVVAISICLSQAAFAYDTGAMSCEEIGQYAAVVMAERGKGQSKADALATVGSQTQWPGAIEKSNLNAVVDLIHGKTGDQLYDEKAAYAVIKRDCDIGQRRRQQ